MRNLNENTLTGIDLNASNTGNMNSSRAGVAGAVAQRGFDDRRADVAMGIQDRLVDRSLAQQAQQFSDQGRALQSAGTANDGISSAYNMGLNTVGEGANFGMNAGNSLQGYSQAELDDLRRRFESNRDFEMEQRSNYQNGILGRAPNSSQSVSPSMANPFAAAMSGAISSLGSLAGSAMGASATKYAADLEFGVDDVVGDINVGGGSGGGNVNYDLGETNPYGYPV